MQTQPQIVGNNATKANSNKLCYSILILFMLCKFMRECKLCPLKYHASTGKNKLLRFVHPKQTNPVILHLQDWQTVDREAFTIRANNQRSFKLKEAIEEGSYNILMQNQPLYNSEAHTFESSHNLFRSAFSEGFPWELLEVFSGNVKFIISKKLD